MSRFTSFTLLVLSLSVFVKAGVLLDAFDQLSTIISKTAVNCPVNLEVIYEVDNGFSIIIGENNGGIESTVQEVNAGVIEFVEGQEHFHSVAVFSSPHAFKVTKSTDGAVLRTRRDVAEYDSDFIDGIPQLYDSKIT